MYDHDIQMKVAKIIEQISDVHGKQTDIYSALFLFDDLLKHMPLVETYTSDTLKAMKLAYAGLNHAYQKITKRSFDNELEIFIQETISSVQKIYNKLILDRISLEHAFNQKYPEFQHLDIRDPKILKYLNDLIQDKKNDVLYAEKRAEEEQTFEQIRYYFQVEIEMLLLMEEMSEILMKVRWMDHHHMLEYIKEFQEKLNDVTDDSQWQLFEEQLLQEQFNRLILHTQTTMMEYSQKESNITEEIARIKPQITKKVQQAEKLYAQAKEEEKMQEKELIQRAALQTEIHMVDDLYKIKTLEMEREATQIQIALAQKKLAQENNMIEAYGKAESLEEKRKILEIYQNRFDTVDLEMRAAYQEHKEKVHQIKMVGNQQQYRLDAYRLKKGFEYTTGMPLINPEGAFDDQPCLQAFEQQAKAQFAEKKAKLATLLGVKSDKLSDDNVNEILDKKTRERFETVLNYQNENTKEIPLPPPPPPLSREKNKSKDTHLVVGLQLVYQIVELQGKFGMSASKELKEAVIEKMKEDNIDANYKDTSTKIFVKEPLSDTALMKYEEFAKLKAEEIKNKYQMQITKEQVLTMDYQHKMEEAKARSSYISSSEDNLSSSTIRHDGPDTKR